MSNCKKCNQETKTKFFDLCERCYAFSVFEETEPQAEIVERVKKNICIPCGKNFHYPIESKADCMYCNLVRKHYEEFKNLKTKL